MCWSLLLVGLWFRRDRFILVAADVLALPGRQGMTTVTGRRPRGMLYEETHFEFRYSNQHKQSDDCILKVSEL